jgi:hypothetical protein
LNFGKPIIYFVGLSAKPNCDHLSTQTKTGNVIEQIIHGLPDVTSIKTNLVKNPPLDQRGNLRYPNSFEMERGWEDLQNDMTYMSPNLIVTLGQQVSFFIRTQMGVQPAKPLLPTDFSSKTYLSQSEPYLLSVHHPSFVFVYRRNYIENYVNSVIQSISSLVLK